MCAVRSGLANRENGKRGYISEFVVISLMDANVSSRPVNSTSSCQEKTVLENRFFLKKIKFPFSRLKA